MLILKALLLFRTFLVSHSAQVHLDSVSTVQFELIPVGGFLFLVTAVDMLIRRSPMYQSPLSRSTAAHHDDVPSMVFWLLAQSLMVVVSAVAEIGEPICPVDFLETICSLVLFSTTDDMLRSLVPILYILQRSNVSEHATVLLNRVPSVRKLLILRSTP